MSPSLSPSTPPESIALLPSMAAEFQSFASTPLKGKFTAYLVCWLLGNGCLFSFNSMLTIEDYYSYLFPRYHPTRVFTLVYQPFALITLSILAYYEARVNTRLRILFGYSLFFLSSILLPVIDLATTGHGGIGPFIGICLMIAVFGIADAHVQGGMMGDLSFTSAELIQSFSAGLATSGAATSGLRLITRAAFEDSQDGLRKGALTFFFLSSFFVLLCILLYSYVFPHLEIMKYYRSKVACEGSKTVVADLAVAGVTSKDLEQDGEAGKFGKQMSNMNLLMQNAVFLFDIFIIYVLTLSIFPGFLVEDTGKHQLGSWYALVLIAMFNVGDLIGRFTPLMGILRLESRLGLLVASLFRFVLVPLFYFTAKYGTQGWMLVLCIVLGLSNGHLSVCIFITAPKGYKGPEQNALGNFLVLFLLIGIFAGVSLDWLWLIGKGW